MTESEYDGLAEWEKELLGEFTYVTADDETEYGGPAIAPLVGSVTPASASKPRHKYQNTTNTETASVYEFFYNDPTGPYSISVIDTTQRRAEEMLDAYVYTDDIKPQLIAQRPATKEDFEDQDLKF